jgi:hypothetical protein
MRRKFLADPLLAAGRHLTGEARKAGLGSCLEFVSSATSSGRGSVTGSKATAGSSESHTSTMPDSGASAGERGGTPSAGCSSDCQRGCWDERCSSGHPGTLHACTKPQLPSYALPSLNLKQRFLPSGVLNSKPFHEIARHEVVKPWAVPVLGSDHQPGISFNLQFYTILLRITRIRPEPSARFEVGFLVR